MNLLIDHFSGFNGPRELRRYRPLRKEQEALACHVSGSDDMELQHGIPSHDTFRRVFSLIDAEAFEQCFTAWTASRADAFEDEIVAIDGKTMRRSFDLGTGQSLLHIADAP